MSTQKTTVTVDGKTYTGIGTLNAGGKTLVLTPDALTDTKTLDTITENGTTTVDVSGYRYVKISVQVSSGTTKILDSITATYSGGSVVAGTAVTALTDIEVTAHYTDSTTYPDETVTYYTLSGDLSEAGTKTVTASYTYGGVTKSASFTVEVTAAPTTTHNLIKLADIVWGYNVNNYGTVLTGDDRNYVIIPVTPGHVYGFINETNNSGDSVYSISQCASYSGEGSTLKFTDFTYIGSSVISWNTTDVAKMWTVPDGIYYLVKSWNDPSTSNKDHMVYDETVNGILTTYEAPV